jgi:hypothetical protein
MRIDSAGNVGIATGGASLAGNSFILQKSITGATIGIAFLNSGIVQPDVTGAAYYHRTAAATVAGSYTVGTISHYYARQGTFGAGSTVTSQYGFEAHSTLIGATNNFGFHSNIPAGTGRWNFFANGTAQNAFAGFTSIGSTTVPTCALDVTGGIRTSRTAVTAPAASDGNVFSGTYTPTLTNVTNVTSSTALTNITYFRVGNAVTVSGQVNINATATGAVEFGVSLPVASNFSASQQAGGASGSPVGAGYISADATNDRLSLKYTASATGTQAHFFTATYQVL